jgi:hypothetical protein
MAVINTVMVVEFFDKLGIANKELLIQTNKKREQTANPIANINRQLNMTRVNLDNILPDIKSLFPVSAILTAVVIEKRIVKRIIFTIINLK